ncbi:MAG TPA: DUF6152 family protein [Bryobacteraceae bacterium]|nr:DUF6152 family protein [Bryobacteraceae bacterium]
MKFKFAALSAAVGLLFAALPALAHHSFAAEFDVKKPITLKGKFVKMDWVNPHSQIQVEVTGADGKPVIWSFEALPPNVLFRMGWRKTSIQPGEEIEIEGFQAKDGSTNAWVRSVKTADGRRLFAGKADALPPGAPAAPKDDK